MIVKFMNYSLAGKSVFQKLPIEGHIPTSNDAVGRNICNLVKCLLCGDCFPPFFRRVTVNLECFFFCPFNMLGFNFARIGFYFAKGSSVGNYCGNFDYLVNIRRKSGSFNVYKNQIFVSKVLGFHLLGTTLLRASNSSFIELITSSKAFVSSLNWSEYESPKRVLTTSPYPSFFLASFSEYFSNFSSSSLIFFSFSSFVSLIIERGQVCKV